MRKLLIYPIIFYSLSFVACSQSISESDIIGIWKIESGLRMSDKNIAEGSNTVYTFLENGILIQHYGIEENRIELKWRLENNSIVLSQDQSIRILEIIELTTSKMIISSGNETSGIQFNLKRIE